MSSILKSHFKLHRPCSDCPFLKGTSMELMPGRLEGIIETLVEDDHSTFQCHKTVHNSRTGGSWDDEGNYEATGLESMCAGAMIYLEKKIGRPTGGMRIGRLFGEYSPEMLQSHFSAVIEPGE